MNPRLEQHILDCIQLRDERHPLWARIIAEGIVNYRYSVAKSFDLIPIVQEWFADAQQGEDPEPRLAEVLARSPVLVDRAIAVILKPSLPDPEPAVIVDRREPGATWLVVYADHSMLDENGMPWLHWYDYVSQLRSVEPEGSQTVYLTRRATGGKPILPLITRAFERVGYRVG